MLTGNMPEHTVLYLPSLTADYVPQGMQNLTMQLHQLRTRVNPPSTSSSWWATPLLSMSMTTPVSNLGVTGIRKIGISLESLLRWPAKPLAIFPPDSPVNCWKATGSHQLEQASFSLILSPKFIEKFFQLLRVPNLGVRCHSLWRKSPPLPEQWAIPHSRICPSPLHQQHQAGSVTLEKVVCLMVTFETCHKGKISKCTWNLCLSSATDSLHSIFELPAVKMNSAALLPCRVPLSNQSLPSTVPSGTVSELQTRTWGSAGAGHLMLLSWGWSCSEQSWLLSPLPLSDQSKAPHPHLSLLPRQLCWLGIPPIPRSQSWITQMQMLYKNTLFSCILTNVGISPF